MTIILNESSPLVKFELQHSFSHITIKKIIYQSILNEDKWIGKLSSTTIKISYKNRLDESKIKMFNLGQFISPMHQFPIMEVNIVVPYENSQNFSSFKPFFNSLEIEAVFRDGEEVDDYKIEMDFEKTPGVKKIV